MNIKGYNRHESVDGVEHFITPQKIVEHMMDLPGLDPGGMDVFEPCCGDVAPFIKVAKALGAKSLSACEQRQVEIPDGVGVFHSGDFLKDWYTGQQFDRIYMNPPFSNAHDFILQSIKYLRRDGKLVCLAPLRLLETSKRARMLWDLGYLEHMYVLKKRITFVGHKSSYPQACCWYVFKKQAGLASWTASLI